MNIGDLIFLYVASHCASNGSRRTIRFELFVVKLWSLKEGWIKGRGELSLFLFIERVHDDRL